MSLSSLSSFFGAKKVDQPSKASASKNTKSPKKIDKKAAENASKINIISTPQSLPKGTYTVRHMNANEQKVLNQVLEAKRDYDEADAKIQEAQQRINTKLHAGIELGQETKDSLSISANKLTSIFDSTQTSHLLFKSEIGNFSTGLNKEIENAFQCIRSEDKSNASSISHNLLETIKKTEKLQKAIEIESLIVDNLSHFIPDMQSLNDQYLNPTPHEQELYAQASNKMDQLDDISKGLGNYANDDLEKVSQTALSIINDFNKIMVELK